MFDSQMIQTSMCVSAEACGSGNVSTQICSQFERVSRSAAFYIICLEWVKVSYITDICLFWLLVQSEHYFKFFCIITSSVGTHKVNPCKLKVYKQT